jgi:hypothetical protein
LLLSQVVGGVLALSGVYWATKPAAEGIAAPRCVEQHTPRPSEVA